MGQPANRISRSGKAVVHPSQVTAYASLRRMVELSDGNLSNIMLTHQIYHWTDPKGKVHMAAWEEPSP